MATRVVMIDPWWNTAIEQQGKLQHTLFVSMATNRFPAFCRIFRIGQDKPTEMTRFCVKNTIDERILAIQQRKQAEIDPVMKSSSERKNLTVKELMNLFGSVEEQEGGKPFIIVEDKPVAQGFYPDSDAEMNLVDDP
jgi:hypothetical protein